MHTSYFAKYKNGGVGGVNIALKHPPGFIGPSYPDLFPTWSMLKALKETGDIGAYEEEYAETILSKLDPDKVYNDLKDNIILCWEKSGEFCHRYLVSMWLENELSVIITEVGMFIPGQIVYHHKDPNSRYQIVRIPDGRRLEDCYEEFYEYFDIKTNHIWVRRKSQMEDGRFIPVSKEAELLI